MHIWIIFLSIVFILLNIIERSNQKTRTVLENLLIIITVYFAAFRDGMGEDYSRYVYRTEFINSGEELINDLITNIVYFTPLSPIFYFLVTSLLIYPIIIKLFLKQRHYILIIMSFFFSTGLGYPQSFNVIRQFVVVAFFFLATQYIVERKYLVYFSLVIIASLFHASGFFLLPFIFFMDRRFKKKLLMFLIIFSLVGAQLLSPLSNLLIRNTQYSEYELVSRSSSMMFLVLSILMIIVIMNNKDRSPKNNLIINGGFLCVFLFNLSVSSIAFSRFSLYFAPFLFISLFELVDIAKNKVVGVLIMCFFMYFFISYLSGSVMPEKILPINSIFDSVYRNLSIPLH